MGSTPIPEPGLKKWCVAAGLPVRAGKSGVKLRSFLESLPNEALNDVLIVSAANATIMPAVRKPKSFAISYSSLHRVVDEEIVFFCFGKIRAFLISKAGQTDW